MNMRANVVRGIALASLAVLAPSLSARADVKLPKIISDHMVLQREMPAPIWGWAEPGEEVAVSIAGQTKTAKADDAGKWLVKLDPIKAEGPFDLSVKGKNEIQVKDVLVGEVWLASGQSNMALRVQQARDFDKEKEKATDPRIRMFTVRHKNARKPLDDCEGSWVVCSPETVGGFSATAYFFGKDLAEALKKPIGLIHSSVGGTPIEAWTSIDVQKNRAELSDLFSSWEKRAATYDPEVAKENYEKARARWKELAAQAKADGKQPPRAPAVPSHPLDDSHHPAVLFNGMIAPLIPYAIRGAIWYQGESNCGYETKHHVYRTQLELLIKDWRTRFGEGDFPFAWVQLPNYGKRDAATGWPLVREAMLQALDIPKTGMAIAIDIGEAKDVHPKNKQDVGRRLALWARSEVYGERVGWAGPLLAGTKANEHVIELSFIHTEGALKVRGEGELRGFEIAGADKKWHRAVVEIDATRLVVSSPNVHDPVYVRYDWADDPDGNLINKDGLPASPFRTDKD